MRFETFSKAMEMAKTLKEKGYKAIVNEFYDFNGKFYNVMFWRA